MTQWQPISDLGTRFYGLCNTQKAVYDSFGIAGNRFLLNKMRTDLPVNKDEKHIQQSVKPARDCLPLSRYYEFSNAQRGSINR